MTFWIGFAAGISSAVVIGTLIVIAWDEWAA